MLLLGAVWTVTLCSWQNVISHRKLQLPCFPRDIMDHSLKPQPRTNLLSLQLLFVQYLFCHNKSSTNPQVSCPGSRTQINAPRKTNGPPFISTQWWLVRPSVLTPLLLGCASHLQISISLGWASLTIFHSIPSHTSLPPKPPPTGGLWARSKCDHRGCMNNSQASNTWRVNVGPQHPTH